MNSKKLDQKFKNLVAKVIYFTSKLSLTIPIDNQISSPADRVRNKMAENLHSAEYLTKQISKLLHRIERVMIPSNEVVHSNISSRISSLSKKIKAQAFFEDIELPPVAAVVGKKSAPRNQTKDIPLKKVSWDKLEKEIIFAISDGDVEGFVAPSEVINEIEDERRLQSQEVLKLQGKLTLARLQVHT